jgi:hypothetical protein
MLPVTSLLSTWKMVIEAFCPVLDVLDESLHQVLPFCTINMMRQTQPPARVVVPLGSICIDWLPAIPSAQQLKEMVAYENGSLSREMCIMRHESRAGSYAIHSQ